MMFSLFGGVFADRMDRRKMLLASQYIQMTCAFTLALLFTLHVVKVWHILTLSFVVGLGQSFGGPAYSSLLPTLVEPEDLSNAIAMNSIQFNIARVLGPILGGLAYTMLGATWCFTLNGISYLAVIASLFMIQVKFIPAKTTESVMRSMKRGHPVHKAARRHERAGGAGVLHHAVRFFAERISSRLRAQHLPPRAGDLYAAAVVLRRGIHLRRPRGGQPRRR